MDLGKIRNDIIEAIREFQSNGGHLVRSHYGVTWDDEVHQWKNQYKHCACALGCVILKNQPGDGNFSYVIGKALGIEYDDAVTFTRSFTAGFDGASRVDTLPEAYSLGKEVAVMFNPGNFDQVPGPDEDEEDDYDYGRDPEPTDNYGLN